MAYLEKLLLAGLGLATMMAVAGPAAAQDQIHPDPPLYMQARDAFANKSIEQKVQELVDREEIRDMISTYAHRVAHGVPHDEQFVDGGVFTIRRLPDEAVEVHAGKAAISNSAQATVARFGNSLIGPNAQRPLPMIHNFLIAIDGDEAIGINSNELRIPEKGKSIIASGYYEDRYRRVNGYWKFVRRDTTFIHWVPIQEGWATPAK